MSRPLRILLMIALCTGIFCINSLTHAQVVKQEISAREFISKLTSQPSSTDKITLSGYTVTDDLDLHTVSPIKNPLELQAVDFEGEVNADGVEFENEVDMSAVHFERGALLGAKFDKTVTFSQVIFDGETTFSSAIFNATATFRLVHFNDKSVSADFTNTTFNDNVICAGCSFASEAFFTGVTFGKVAGFSGITFPAAAHFNSAVFIGSAIFIASKFHDVDFSGSIFEDHANFSNTTFGDDPNNAVFTSAQLSGALYNAVFTSAQFKDDLDFSNAEFFGIANFDQATFDKLTSFHGVQFHDSVTFEDSHLNELDFTRVTVPNKALNLNHTAYKLLDAREFNFAALKTTADYIDVLELLEDKFRAQNQLELANEAYYVRRVVERGQYRSHIQQFAETLFLDDLLGYFVLPMNIINTSVVLIVAFAIIYFIILKLKQGTLTQLQISAPQPRTRKFSLHLSDIPINSSAQNQETRFQKPKSIMYRIDTIKRELWQPLNFSLTVFTKIGYGEYEAKGTLLETLTVIEWILGYIAIGGLIFTLSQSIPALRDLLRPFAP